MNPIERVAWQLRDQNAQIVGLRENLRMALAEANESWAAIERVRGLCDVAHADCQEEFIPAMDGYVLFLKVDDVLRALDGAE